MKKIIASGLMLTLLLIGMLTLAFNIQQVKASGTIYIMANGSINPPTANITSVDNVTYNFTGNILDEIVVERDNIVIDGAGYTLQGTGAYESKGVDLSDRSNVTIKNTIITAFYYGIDLDSSSNNSISGNNIANHYDGIRLRDSSNYNSISGNNITESNSMCIRLSYSCNYNSISGNNIANHTGGIVLRDSSNYNSVSGNNITTTVSSLYGIDLGSSSNNRISGNNIASHSNGIQLRSSNYNSVSGNNITESNNYGIHLSSSSNNSISGNNITESSLYGIIFQYSSSNNRISGNNIISDWVSIWLHSSNNRFYHNNFVSNTDHVYSYESINVWDDGYPSGGNYWSDYAGVDLYSGPDQNESGSDGIGDTSYVIDVDNQDRYPFMNPWTDTTPPETTISLSGVLGDNDWFTSDVTVTLSAMDDTEVDKTEYSFDNAAWNIYTAPFVLTSEGTTTVYYKSTDKAGNPETTKTRTIKIDKTEPSANAGVDQTVNEDTLATFDGSASTDQNGIAAYTWTFTDTTPQTLSGENPTYTFETPGTYTITLEVADPAGHIETDTVTINVLDKTTPVANAGQDQTVNVDATVSFDAGASSDNMGIVSYEWDFGDQTTGTGKTTTHTYTSQGTYTATLTVKDSAGNSATDTITVTVLPEEAPPPPTEPFPIWIVGVAIAAIVIALAAALLLRKQK